MIRWVFVAALAIEIFLLVPPGHSPLFGWHIPPATEPTRLETEVNARANALRLASFGVKTARAEAELAPWLGASGRDVEVLIRDHGRLVIDSERTAYATRLWTELPVRYPGVRTILVPMEGTIVSGWRPSGSGGVCIAGWVQGWGRHPDHRQELSGSSGLCGLYAAYGPPGRTVQRWLARRPPRWLSLSYLTKHASMRRLPPDPEEYDETSLERLSTGGLQLGWGFNPSIRRLDMVACAHGRPDRCRSGYAVDDSMTVVGFEYGSGFEPLGMMAWFLDADQFQAVWRTTHPLSESFAEATGFPIEDRLAVWTTGHLFTTRHDPPTRAVLIGALLWLVLLGGWTTLRFAAR